MMKKKEFVGNRKWIWTCCVGLGLCMVVLVLCSMYYFQYKIKQSSKLVDTLDYKTYDNYYVMITDNNKSIFWQSVYEGALQEAQKKGIYVEMLGDNLNREYDKEELMNIAINSKVDGIVVEADESETMKECIRRANEAGIPVVTALYDTTEGVRQSYVGVSSYKLGAEYGIQICEIVKRKPEGKYSVLILLDKEKTDSSQNILIAAIRERIHAYGMDHRIAVETEEIVGDSVFAAEESIRDIFMKEEGLPDIMVCLNEQNTTCVCQTVIDYNKVGQVEIIGNYVSETILSAVEKEIVYSTIAIDTMQMGKYCVEALYEYSQSGYVSDYFGVDVSLINKKNLKDFKEGGANEATD